LNLDICVDREVIGMTNFVVAIIIGIVIGAIGAVILRRQMSVAVWLAPTGSIVGALVAAILGAAFGHAGYGWKKASLQVVLAIVGVVAAAVLARRKASSAPVAGAGRPAN
jgi:uncharacterized membrane protein YeaQ/YmgE (transglycosylase-associated protein family)